MTPAILATRPILSVRQPWAWLILHLGKDIENRCWPTTVRGRIYVHAGKTMTRAEYLDALAFMSRQTQLRELLPKVPRAEEIPRGGIVGAVNLVDCVEQHGSPWFMGEFGFVLADPEPLELFPLQGRLGFFTAATP